MTKTKIFWLAFLCTAAIFLPIYLLTYAFTNAQIKTQPQTVTEEQSNVLITNPTTDDVYTILLMSGTSTAGMADSYALIHFDALKNVISVTSMPPQTVVLLDKDVMTLQEAVTRAGPSNGAKALSQTLGITVTDYIFASPDKLSDTAQVFGNITLLLKNYINEATLKELGFVNEQNERYTVSAQYFKQILQTESIGQSNINEVRSLGYSAFLAAGHGRLAQIIPQAISENSKSIATNINATKLFDYERILKFIDRQQPTYYAMAMPGGYSADGERFELNEESLEFVRLAFNAEEIDPSQLSGEDEEKTDDPENDDAFEQEPIQQQEGQQDSEEQQTSEQQDINAQ